MKTTLSIFFSFLLWMNISAQQASQRVVATSNGKAISIQPIKRIVADNSLPPYLYKTLRDSCNMIDLVYSVGGSMSLNGRNVQLFSSFVEQKGTKKNESLPKEGFIMWQINGREFLTGDMYFSSDTTGYLVFKKDDKEYINTLNKQGAGFLKKQKK
jgi:hypothetical protein